MTKLSSPAWLPPANPDVRQIQQEVSEDRRAKRFEDALAKVLWFHEHVLEHEPSMRGVRLSFALAEWLNLAETYPPAMEAMCAARDRAEDEVRKGGDIAQALRDATALNQTLGEPARNVALYKILDANYPDLARSTLPIVYTSLVETGEYALCGKYMDADQLFNSAVELHGRMTEQRANLGNHAEVVLSLGKARFKAEVCTIVGVLTINGMSLDAQRIAASIRNTLDAPDLEATLVSALRGELPEPWPGGDERAHGKAMRKQMREMGL